MPGASCARSYLSSESSRSGRCRTRARSFRSRSWMRSVTCERPASAQTLAGRRRGVRARSPCPGWPTWRASRKSPPPRLPDSGSPPLRVQNDDPEPSARSPSALGPPTRTRNRVPCDHRAVTTCSEPAVSGVADIAVAGIPVDMPQRGQGCRPVAPDGHRLREVARGFGSGRCNRSELCRWSPVQQYELRLALAGRDLTARPSGNKATSTTPGPFAQLTVPSAAALPGTWVVLALRGRYAAPRRPPGRTIDVRPAWPITGLRRP
jgi:hypothetical protein